MAAPQLMARKRGSKHQQRRRLRFLGPKETREAGIERTQPAALDPLVEHAEHTQGVALGVDDGEGVGGAGRHSASFNAYSAASSPSERRANSASSSSINSRGGRSICKPCPGARPPRRNR
jgi:hypothetical protein